MNIGQLLGRYFTENVTNAIAEQARIKTGKSLAHISYLERKSLVRAIKSFTLTIKKARPFSRSRAVLGSVDTTEIDPVTCRSKINKSLFFAGDVMDVLGPWGGYNMQFAFSSGYVAGQAAADSLS